jgi:uridine kinase
MDDFFLQPYQRTKERFNEIGGNIDWERFLDEVLIPLRNYSKICYRKFNCATMSLGEKIEVIPNKLIVVEGVYSLHPKLEEFYDLSIYLDVSPKIQKERILKRNNSVFAKRFFEEWIPLENKYFNETDIKKRSDIVIKISSR